MADTEEMDREGAETYLRLLGEATMRRALAAAQDQHGPDPGGHRTRLLSVGQALTAVGAMDPVTLEEILVDFNLAMSLRQLGGEADQGSGLAVRAARLISQSQSVHQMPEAWAVRMSLGLAPGGQGPAGRKPAATGPEAAAPLAGAAPEPDTGASGGTPERIIPVGLTVPFRDTLVSGELYLMAFVHTGTGPRFFAVWSIRAPVVQDAVLIPFAAFTVTDDRGARYELDFMPGVDAGWTSEISLKPAPPPGARWLDITAPGSKTVRADLSPGRPAKSAALVIPDRPLVSDVTLSPGELLLVVLAERLLTAVRDYPHNLWRPAVMVAPPAQRALAAALGDITAALEAAGVLSPLSPVPARLATLCASLDLPEHGITVPPAPRLPEPWLSVLSHYQRRKPEPVPLLEGYAAMTATLPAVDGIRLTLLGLHHTDGGTSLHVLIRGALPEDQPMGPFGLDLSLPLSIWLRDSGGRWHVARSAERRRGGPREAQDGECTMRLQLVPPLTRATPWAEVLAAGQTAEVRARVPLRWGYPS